jgi:hypothetical protein
MPNFVGFMEDVPGLCSGRIVKENALGPIGQKIGVAIDRSAEDGLDID